MFSSGLARYDAAYAKAVSVISSDVVDGKFIAGESWAQVWTRDTSYSIDLGAGLLYPAVAKQTLLGMIENVAGIGEVWVQDRAGHFGGWPNLTDSIVGAQGAWSLYSTTGDQGLLEWSYGITVNTLARAERDVYLADAGLFGGCSSFMESNSGYPIKYMNTKTLLAKTKALSTNLLYYRGYDVAAKMGKLLGKDVRALEAKAARLKDAINLHLWQEDRGYYAYFEDENGVKETRMEGTGESFAILWGVADRRKTRAILASTPSTPSGIPSLWPQYAEWMDYTKGDADYYHNGMVWPFVQGYWGWAATKGKSASRVAHELDRIRYLSEKNDTFQEFYQPETGTPDGSRRQLWSASGYLSMVYHGLMGMSFDPDGITFAPVVPSIFERVTLDSIPYRNMTLNIRVTGSGIHVAKFYLDGRRRDDHRVPAHLTGTHRVSIRMANRSLAEDDGVEP
ncbi:MGH1-like glycoside hydrolase domain-containing protein [Pendulispora albinea]|uniref:Mannosylglycerate hydrolase MGH1-like glycoside hydrolase domain-containing protein n=1 Tax=Pendulispora albinea TaxID=2741071 RepID=A0ABZ2M8W9_9BACT